MAKEFFTKIVGVSVKNDDGLERQSHIKRFAKLDKEVLLRREPRHPKDPNAIATDLDCRYMAFFTGRLQIGYLGADVASTLAPHMDAGKPIKCTITGLTGGGSKTLGVNVKITIQ